MLPTNHAPATDAPPDNLADQDLATWLDARLAAGHRVAHIHAGFLCKVVDLDEPPPNRPRRVGPRRRKALPHLPSIRSLTP